MLAKAQLSPRVQLLLKMFHGAVVAGTPAKVIKQTSEVEDSKREIVSNIKKIK